MNHLQSLIINVNNLNFSNSFFGVIYLTILVFPGPKYKNFSEKHLLQHPVL